MKLELMELWKDPLNMIIKLDIVTQVVLYHLKQNSRAPLMAAKDGCTLLDEPHGINDNKEYTEDDWIIIYSAFPSSNQVIIDISHWIPLLVILSYIQYPDSYIVQHWIHQTPWEFVLEEMSTSVE